MNMLDFEHRTARLKDEILELNADKFFSRLEQHSKNNYVPDEAIAYIALAFEDAIKKTYQDSYILNEKDADSLLDALLSKCRK